MAVQHMQPGADLEQFFEEILSRIDNAAHRSRALEVLEWVHSTYPELGVRIAWNQPMFTLDNTFIIGFSYAKKHLAVAPEPAGIEKFSEQFSDRGFPTPPCWCAFPGLHGELAADMHLDLLGEMIEFNMADKEGMEKFWC